MLGHNLIDPIYEIKSSKSSEESEGNEGQKKRKTLGDELRDDQSHNDLVTLEDRTASKLHESEEIFQESLEQL